MSFSVAVTVQTAGTLDPLANAIVTMSADDGASVVSRQATSLSGTATFLLDAGAYRATIELAGYETLSDQRLDVFDDTAVVYALQRLFYCPVSDTGEPNFPFLVRRKGTGAPDGRGGYADVVDETSSFCGRVRRVKRNVDPTVTPTQGTTGLMPNFIFSDRTDLDIRESDVIAEARDDGSGAGTLEEVPGGSKFRVRQVRVYDDEMQIDVDHIAKDLR